MSLAPELLDGRLAVVIPGKDVHATLPRVLSELPPALLPYTFVVDDGSSPPLDAPGVHILRHPVNRGYGAAQKTGYRAAREAGAELVALLHGDGQYDTEDVLALAAELHRTGAAWALGSRFLQDGGASIPWWRRWANRGLTEVANRRFGVKVSELHTGARAFRLDALATLAPERFSDDYVFDQQVLVALLARDLPLRELPVRVRYDDSVQSITLGRSVRYGLGCLGAIARGST